MFGFVWYFLKYVSLCHAILLRRQDGQVGRTPSGAEDTALCAQQGKSCEKDLSPARDRVPIHDSSYDWGGELVPGHPAGVGCAREHREEERREGQEA